MKSSFVAVLSGALACLVGSGCIVVKDDGDPEDEIRADTGPTSRQPKGDHADTCAVAPEYGAVDPYDEGAAFTGETEGGDRYMFVETTVDDGGDHLVSVDLWDGYGAFEGGWETGEWELAGVENDFETCGACVYVLEDFDDETGEYGRLLMAEDGWLEVDAIDPTPGSGHLTGRVRDAHFREVEVEEDGSYEVEQGCTSGFDMLEFDVAVDDVANY